MGLKGIATDNVFCSTGPGGGVDPTFSSGNGVLRDSKGEEYTITHTSKTQTPDPRYSPKDAAAGVVYTRHRYDIKTKDGSRVGEVELDRRGESVSHVAIDPAFQRRGIATAAYSHVESHLGIKLKENATTPEGEALWASRRRKGLTDNVFCPTGEGGGVDPTCSPGEGGGSTGGDSKGASTGLNPPKKEDLDNPTKVLDHIKSYMSVTPGFEKRVTDMNPNGVKDGVLKIPWVNKDQLSSLKQLLPPGVKIKQGTYDPKTKDLKGAKKEEGKDGKKEDSKEGGGKEGQKDYSTATHLHDPKGLLDHLEPHLSMTAGMKDKLTSLNPNGIKDGVFKTPWVTKEQLQTLKSILPQGVKIKQGTYDPKTKDLRRTGEGKKTNPNPPPPPPPPDPKDTGKTNPNPINPSPNPIKQLGVIVDTVGTPAWDKHLDKISKNPAARSQITVGVRANNMAVDLGWTNKYQEVMDTHSKELDDLHSKVVNLPPPRKGILSYEERLKEDEAQNKVYDVLRAHAVNPMDKVELSVAHKIGNVKTPIDFLGGNLHSGFKDIVKDTPIVEIKGVRARYGGTRHGLPTPKIELDPSDGTDVVAHELGHALETDEGVYRAARGFLALRAKGEIPTPLGSNFRADEVGIQDELHKAFTGGTDPISTSLGIRAGKYAGKSYDRDTEIVSSGLELLTIDPHGFATRDPEYFKFVVGVIHGKFSNGKRRTYWDY